MTHREPIQNLLLRARKLDKQGQSEQAQRLRERAKRRLRAAINSQTGVN
jgi:hypothetical protein